MKHDYDLVLHQEGQADWATYIINRVHKRNTNFVGFFSGKVGTGKSYSCLSLAEQIDPSFNIDKVCFKAGDLMRKINSGELKTGNVIVWEEVGIEMSNRNWQSLTNKMVNYLLQTFRHQRLVLLMNAPYLDFVDSSTRKLIDAEFVTLRIDKKRQVVVCKPHLIQYNGRKSKFYYKRLRVILPRGVVPLDKWGIPKPSQKLIDAYEERKAKFTKRLNKEIESDLSKLEDKDGKKELTEIQKDTLDMLKAGLNLREIAKERNRNVEVIRSSFNLIKKKGYELQPVYNEGKIASYLVFDPSGKKISQYTEPS